jgi:uncharacterized protein (TIGR02996 family)
MITSPTSPEEAAFLQAILATPNDLSLRLVFADWLEERGDPRGELLRLTHTLTQEIDVPKRAKLETRLRRLLREGVQPIGPFWTNNVGMQFAVIPPGKFMMGSPTGEPEREANETQHRVTVTRGFALGVHQVTQAQWQAVMGYNRSHFKGDTLPIESINWFHAVDFCNNLSEKTGKNPYYRRDRENVAILGGIGYRLPTEAEWEYACRAGTTTAFHFGPGISTKKANYNGNFSYDKGTKGENRRKTIPVGSFSANVWGLFDMHGNVWQWCWDRFGDYPVNEVTDPQGLSTVNYRVLRGGSWSVLPRFCRSAARYGSSPTRHGDEWGVRVCCYLD